MKDNLLMKSSFSQILSVGIADLYESL